MQVYDVIKGHQVATLRSGHFESITSCQWVASLQRLFSAGCDGAIVAWEAKPGEAGGVVGRVGVPHPAGAGAGDVDRWSEDEDAWLFGEV
jgi:WD40 repeat protein